MISKSLNSTQPFHQDHQQQQQSTMTALLQATPAAAQHHQLSSTLPPLAPQHHHQRHHQQQSTSTSTTTTATGTRHHHHHHHDRHHNRTVAGGGAASSGGVNGNHAHTTQPSTPSQHSARTTSLFFSHLPEQQQQSQTLFNSCRRAASSGAAGGAGGGGRAPSSASTVDHAEGQRLSRLLEETTQQFRAAAAAAAAAVNQQQNSSEKKNKNSAAATAATTATIQAVDKQLAYDRMMFQLDNLRRHYGSNPSKTVAWNCASIASAVKKFGGSGGGRDGEREHLDLLREALRHYKACYGSRGVSKHFAAAMSNMAVSLTSRPGGARAREFDAGIALFEKAVRMQQILCAQSSSSSSSAAASSHYHHHHHPHERADPAASVALAAFTSNLGSALFDAGQVERGTQLLQRALKILDHIEKTSPESIDRHKIASSYLELGISLALFGLPESALEFLQSALQRFRSLSASSSSSSSSSAAANSDDPEFHICLSLSGVAFALGLCGTRLQESIEAGEQCVDAFKHLMPRQRDAVASRNGIFYADAMIAQGERLVKMGRRAEGLSLQGDGERLARKIVQSYHPQGGGSENSSFLESVFSSCGIGGGGGRGSSMMKRCLVSNSFFTTTSRSTSAECEQ